MNRTMTNQRHRQAATDCGGWRGGHNGGDDAAKVSPQGTAMSALRPEADIWAGLQQVRFVPKRSLIYLHFTKLAYSGREDGRCRERI